MSGTKDQTHWLTIGLTAQEAEPKFTSLRKMRRRTCTGIRRPDSTRCPYRTRFRVGMRVLSVNRGESSRRYLCERCADLVGFP